MKSRSLLVLGLLTLLSRTAPARAGDEKLAEALFREGRELLDAKDYERACPKLAESFRQDPATGTLLAVALCYEESGRLASAWSAYSEVAERSSQEGRNDRASAARERIAQLDPRVARLTVNVAAVVAQVPGLSLKLDGLELPPAAWGSPLPEDAGPHVVEARAPGKIPFTQSIRFSAEGEAQTITIAALVDAPQTVAATPSATPAAPPAAPASAMPAARPANRQLRIAGLVVGGVGVIGLGIGAGFGLSAISSKGRSNEGGHCDGGCDAQGAQWRRDALRAADTSTVFVVVGGVLVASGAVLYLVGAPSRTETGTVKPASVAVTALAAPGTAGLRFFGDF